MRFALFALVLLLGVASCWAVPTQVHVAFTGKASDVSIMWIGTAANLKYHVQYGFASQKYEKSVSGIYKPYTSVARYSPHVYEAILPHLPAATRIYYRVGSVKDGFSPEYSFTTQQTLETVTYPYRFLSYGDMDLTTASYQTQSYVLKQVQKDELLRFIIHQGDIPYAWTEDRWDTWFNLMQPVTANMPYMVCPGNHESNYDFASYKNRFSKAAGINSNTNSNLYYSWNYGHIHFVALSSEHPYTSNSDQFKWLDKDLQAVNRTQYPFVIFYAHRPMYSSNQNHGSEIQFRKSIEPLLAKHNVNIALFGHVHAYERTCVLQDASVCVNNATSRDLKVVDTSNGTLHIIAGTAGYELNPHWDAKPYWSVFRETNHGSLRLTALNATSIQVEFVRHADEGVSDSFVVNA